MAQLRCTNVAFCCNGCTTFSVDGANGRLLEVTDDLSCSLFSANTIAGLPVVEAFANYCVVMGQYGGHQLQVTCTSIRGGKCTTASGTYSFVGGGVCSLASGKASVIVGGCCNTASGCFSFIGGGGYDDNTAPPATGNTASGCHSVVVGGDGNIVAVGCASVVGGRKNCVSGQQSFIGGGICNLICGGNSALVGGAFNCVTGQIAAVVGGICNTASGYMSFVGGGCCNTSSGYAGTVSGGYRNAEAGIYSAIVAGRNNRICSNTLYNFIGAGEMNVINPPAYFGYAVIVGGASNTVSSRYSSILGGCNNTVGFCNSHIIGSNITANAINYTYVNNLCQTGGGLSDCRVKNTIQPLEFGLNHIAQLQPVSFCWNGDASCHKKYGFIAQNVQQAMSCVVTCNQLHRLGANGTQVLGEEGEPLLEFEKDAIYASYANAIKELKQENDQLKARVEAIEEVLKNNNLL